MWASSSACIDGAGSAGLGAGAGSADLGGGPGSDLGAGRRRSGIGAGARAGVGAGVGPLDSLARRRCRRSLPYTNQKIKENITAKETITNPM